MKNFISEDMRAALKNRWVSLMIGILFLLMGLWMLFALGITFAALVIFVSVFMCVSGIFEIVFSLSNTKMHSWGWYLAVGIADLLVGICLVGRPGLTALVIPFIILGWVPGTGECKAQYSTLRISLILSKMRHMVRFCGHYTIISHCT